MILTARHALVPVFPRRLPPGLRLRVDGGAPSFPIGPPPKPPHFTRLEDAIWNRLAFARRGADGYHTPEEMYGGY